MATTWYLKIIPMTEPQDVGQDASKRHTVNFTVLADKRPSATFPEELIKVLVAAAVGAENVDIFASTSAALPKGVGQVDPFLVIIPSGGIKGDLTHNEPDKTSYPRPGALISVRSVSGYKKARDMAYAAYDALTKVKNQFVTIP